MFKKLFTINYNNKVFLILVNEEHRYAFMEVKDDKLVYPDLEDFKYLFNIFNNKKSVIASKYIGERLDEKVNVKGLLLSIMFVMSSIFPAAKADYKVENDKVIVEYQNGETNSSYITFESVTDLNSYLGYKDITIEELFEVIDNNESFNNRQREITKAIISEKVKINPSIDLRLIYENMKTIIIEYKTSKELLEMYNMSMGGCYDVIKNIIYLTSSNDGLFAHEISHAMHGFYRNINGVGLELYAGRSSFHECITNIEASYALDYSRFRNDEDERMYLFLSNHAEKFDMSVYDEYGINPLIDELKEKYPDVDIEYIIDFFNGAHNAIVSAEPQKISMLDNEYLLDQVYQMVIESIKEENVFDELVQLINLIDNEEISNNYSAKYYKYLLDKGYIGTNEYEFITKMDHLVLYDGLLYIGTSDNKYYNYGLELEDENDFCLNIPLLSNIKNKILFGYGNGDFVYDDEYISNILKDGDIISNDFAYRIKDYDEDDIRDIIDTIFFRMMDDCETLEQLQQQYLLFEDIFDMVWVSDSNYYNVWIESFENNTYFNYYRDYCISNNFVSERNMKIVDEVKYIIEYKGQYYLVKTMSDNANEYNIYNLYNDGFTHNSVIVGSDIINITYLDETGQEKEMSITRDMFTSYGIRRKGSLKIQTYIENNDSEVLSQDFIKSLMNECEVDDKKDYENIFTLSSGEVVYNGELDDNIFIEFGKNEVGEVTCQITKDNQVIYKTCENFIPLSSKITFKTYLGASFYYKGQYLDQLTSQESLCEALYFLQPIMREVKVINDINVEFINPTIVNLDGQNCYARDVYIYFDHELECVCICYPDGSKEGVIRIEDIEENEIFYYEPYLTNYLEYYLDYFNIEPDDKGIYYVTREQIHDMIKNELNETVENRIIR